MIKGILVATDASTASNRALDLAADLASKYDSSLTILHVVREMQADVLKFVAEKIVSEAQQRAKRKGVKNIRTAISEGDPANAIISQAKRRHVDLIVMGTRGLGKVKEVFLGSVSRKVCNLSQINCLTVK
jgi:nucleotide-binding universal stress UspA family protein